MIEAAVRAASVPPFHAMAMSRAATRREAEGHDVFHLEVGEPSYGLPRIAQEAVAAALDRPLGYTNAAGLQQLRHRLADRYNDVSVDRVLVVSGASAGFTLAFLTLFEDRARVGVVEPGYPCYRNALIALGHTPVPIPVGADTRWVPTPEHLDAAGQLDGLVIASPSNPTGTVLDAEALLALTRCCRERGIAIVADEIYHGLEHGPAAPQILDVEQDAFVVNSFSKYYAMTGWRVGWIVVPPQIADVVERLQQNLFICAPHVSQVAALAALDATEELEDRVEHYRVNRGLIRAGLAAAGITDLAPSDGAFYVYAHVPQFTRHLGIDSGRLCGRWLDEVGVATAPGIDFDLARGNEYVRFSYAGEGNEITAACERLAGWTP